jgi:hypothetical protein
MNLLRRVSLSLACVTCGAWIAVACGGAQDSPSGPSPDAASPLDSSTTARDSASAADAREGDADAGTPADASKSADGAGSNDASKSTDASKNADASKGDGSVSVFDAGGEEDAPAPLDCAEAGDIPLTCSQGSPCNCSPGCSVSEGTGPTSCDLSCTCSNADNTGVFQCVQDCPPDAAPPADCTQGVACVPGVECGGQYDDLCLCDNTGHLQCPPGFDGG